MSAPAAIKPDKGADLGRLARGGMLNLVAAAVSGITNLVLVVLVTRGFPKAEAGIFFAATTVFLLGARTSELGTRTGLVYFVARFRARGQKQRISQVLRVAYLPVAGFALVAALVLGLFAPTWAELSIDGDPGPFTGFLRLLAVFLPFAVFNEVFLATTRGYGAMRPSALIENISRPLAQTVLTIGAVAAGSAYFLTTAWALPYVFTSVVAGVWLWRIRWAKAIPAAIEPEPDLAGRFWRFTGPRALTGIVQLALQRLDIVLVAALLGPAEAAVYTAATRFLVVGQLATQAFTQVVEPKLSELIGTGDTAAARTVYQTSTCWTVLLNWPFYLGFVALAPAVLPLFGDGYDDGLPVVLVLGGAMLIATACGMVETVLNMAGRTTWSMANALLALTVTIAVDIVLIPRIGIVGAAIGWAAAIVAKNLLALAQVGASLRLQPMGRGTPLAIVLAVACFGVAPLLLTYVFGTGTAAVLGALVLGTGAYAALCWRFRTVLDLNALLALRRRGRTA